MISIGIDFGRHRDPSALVGIDYSADTWRLVKFRAILGGSWQDTLNELCWQSVNAFPIIADATGVGDALYQ